jgi:hypothetical protein
MGKKIELLKNHAYFSTDLLPIFFVIIKLKAIDDYGSAVHLFQSIETAEECRLSRAGRPDNNDNFLAPDFCGKIDKGMRTLQEFFVDFISLDYNIPEYFMSHCGPLHLILACLSMRLVDVFFLFHRDLFQVS